MSEPENNPNPEDIEIDAVPYHVSFDPGVSPSVTIEVVARYDSRGNLVEFWQVNPMADNVPGYVRKAWHKMKADQARGLEFAEARDAG